MQSSIPAIWSNFLGTGAETIPVPRGAGMSLTQTEPHLPVTLQGTVWGRPILLPQKPRLTGTMESLERMMAPRMAVATSLEHLTPRPTCPFSSPTATMAIHQKGKDAPRSDCGEFQSPEGRVDCAGEQCRCSVSVRCSDPTVHHCEEQGYQEVP